MNQPNLTRLLGTPGDAVPPVDAADLKAAWSAFRELRADHPTGNVALGMGMLADVCSPGADVRAVSYRWMQLAVLSTVPLDDMPELASLLTPLRQNGELTEAALKVGAQFPMKWMALGTHEQMPFDLEAFLAEVQKESEGGV